MARPAPRPAVRRWRCCCCCREDGGAPNTKFTRHLRGLKRGGSAMTMACDGSAGGASSDAAARGGGSGKAAAEDEAGKSASYAKRCICRTVGSRGRGVSERGRGGYTPSSPMPKHVQDAAVPEPLQCDVGVN